VLFIDRMLTDRLGEIYPANYYSYGSSGHPGLIQRIKEKLDGLLFRRMLGGISGDRLSLLDVGGGTGWLASLIKRLEPRIVMSTVVDIDPLAREEAERGGHTYFCGPIEAFPEQEPFDVITMLNLIEHVKDPVGVMKHAQRLLRPGGRLFVKTPNFRSLDAELFQHRNWGGYHCPRHFVIFSKASLLACSTAAGLRCVGFSYTQGAPFWSVAIFDRMRRWGWVTASAAQPAIYHPVMPVLQAVMAGFGFLRWPFSRLSQMTFIFEAQPHPSEDK